MAASDRPPLRQGMPTEPPLEARAAEHLRFIRETMARSSTFTGVPGWGGMAMGATACVAAVLGAVADSERGWLYVWLAEAPLAALIGLGALAHKARRHRLPLRSGVGRKYVLNLLPPLLIGALLTVVLWQTEQAALLPGVWLLLYGAGTVAGGAFSVRLLPIMGGLFIVFGAVALFVPAWGDLLLGLGFGGLHVVFGWIIAQNYGG